MKRLLTLALVLMFVFAPMTAYASEELQPAMPGSTLPKSLSVTGVNPALEFTFTFTDGTVVDGEAEAAPAISDVVVEFAQGSSTLTVGSNDIELDETAFLDLGVGRYKYVVKESASDVLGVTIDDKTGEFWVYVQWNNDPTPKLEVVPYLIIRDSTGVKDDSFDNMYDSGDLTVTKEVTGNLGDLSKEFDITITFTNDSTTQDPDFSAVDLTVGGVESLITAEEITALALTRSISDGESIVFENLPAGLTYVVTEADYTGAAAGDGYDEADIAYGDEGMLIEGDDEDTVTVTNNKSEDVPTGITLDSLPYIILLVGAVAGMTAFTIRRRMKQDE